MGIKDLLRFMKPYTEPIHVQKYAGKRVGIDAYSWLHKGAYSCSMEIYLNSEGDKKFQYINYFMHRVNLLRHHKITPVVVFDGGNMPCKAGTENERGRRRKANKDMAMERLREGNVSAATELFQRAISITPSMAHQLIQTLKSEKVEFVVAPYEADAQLAYLSNLGEDEGGIVAVISEDSDLLAYGCPAIIFKMDRYGNGEEIVLDKAFNSTNAKPSFRNFSTELFIGMCVLAGCDFLPSIHGIGIVKAHSLVSKYRNIDRVLSVLKCDKAKQIPEDYLTSFKESVAVFQHARIYNSKKKSLEHIKPIPGRLLEELGAELDFLGPDMPPSIATAIAEGKLNPISMEAFNCSPGPERQSSEHRVEISSAISVTESRRSQKTDKTDKLGAWKEQVQVMKNDKFSRGAGRLGNSVPAFELLSNKENCSESCFTVFSSQKVEEQSSQITIPRQVLKERNFTDEAAALAKLVTVDSNQSEVQFPGVSDKFPLKTPDNNPFRKRKHSVDIENTPTPESGVTEVERSEAKCEILDSQDSISSKPKVLDAVKETGKGSKKRRTNSIKSMERFEMGSHLVIPI